jgi:hypothetical protein
VQSEEQAHDEEGGLAEFHHLPVTHAEPHKLGAVDKHYSQIRPAGAKATRDDRGEWDEVDEGSDESFPASDPPSYMPPE